jgi:hypothetical protein
MLIENESTQEVVEKSKRDLLPYTASAWAELQAQTDEGRDPWAPPSVDPSSAAPPTLSTAHETYGHLLSKLPRDSAIRFRARAELLIVRECTSLLHLTLALAACH